VQGTYQVAHEGRALAEPGDDRERQERLKRLENRLEAHRKTYMPPPRAKATGIGQANMAWRMVIELVTGLLIGFGIGYGLDLLFGTRPIFLVLFVLFGFAAGVNVMLHTAREIGREAENGAAAQDAEAEGKEKE
jgi:ATP synthase protein I